MVGLVKGIGIGTAVGAGTGAVLADDSATAGAIRGGIAGAAAGSAVHYVPRGISATYKSSGFSRPTEGLVGRYTDDIINSYEPVMKAMKTDQNKELVKSAVPVFKKAFKESTDNPSFSIKSIEGLKDKVKNLNQADLDTLTGLGEKVTVATNAMNSKASTKEMNSYIEAQSKNFKDLSGKKKVGLMTAAAVDAGLNSVNHHLIQPMFSMGNKIKSGKIGDIDRWENSAAAFNTFGLYETYNAANEVSNGQYGSALGTMATVGAGKLAYSQASNLLKLNGKLMDKGTNLYDVTKNVIPGAVGLQKFTNGVKNFTPEQQLHVMQVMTG